jgi:hypothetical protein
LQDAAAAAAAWLSQRQMTSCSIAAGNGRPHPLTVSMLTAAARLLAGASKAAAAPVLAPAAADACAACATPDTSASAAPQQLQSCLQPCLLLLLPLLLLLGAASGAEHILLTPAEAAARLFARPVLFQYVSAASSIKSSSLATCSLLSVPAATPSMNSWHRPADMRVNSATWLRAFSMACRCK